MAMDSRTAAAFRSAASNPVSGGDSGALERDIGNLIRLARDGSTIAFLRSLETRLRLHGGLTPKQQAALDRIRRRLS